MPEAQTYLAIDLGAESGRTILGKFAGEKLTLTETHRFSNGPVRLPDGLHWNLLHLWEEIKGAWANGDREALRRLYAGSTGFIPYEQSQSTVTRQYHLVSLSSLDKKWDDYEVIVTPDLAVIKGYMTWECSGRLVERHYVTSVFKKEDSRWALVHAHVSNIP